MRLHSTFYSTFYSTLIHVQPACRGTAMLQAVGIGSKSNQPISRLEENQVSSTLDVAPGYSDMDVWIRRFDTDKEFWILDSFV